MTRDIGPIPADIILDCHEYWNVEAGQRSCVTEMDNHNNDVGQSLAPVGMPVEGVDQACQNACVAAEKSGQLMTSPPCDDPMCPDFPREGIDIAGEND